MAKQNEPRQVVTYTSIPADRHIVGREDGIVVGRGQDARKVAASKVDIPSDAAAGKKTGQPVARATESAARRSEVSGKDSSRPGAAPQKKAQQGTGCLLMIVIFAIFAIIAMVVLFQNSGQLPGDTGLVTGTEQNISGTFADFTGGDAETGFKLVFGLLGLMSFLAVVLGAFMYFTAGEPTTKARGHSLLVRSGIAFVLLLVINGMIISYYASQEGPSNLPAINIKYLSGFPASAPLDLEFDASGAPETATARFVSWDFGDGTQGAGKTVKHTFTKLGEYAVVAKITAESGEVATYPVYVPVFNILPEVRLETTDLTGGAPLKVSFDASKSSDKNGKVVAYQWVFPGGEVGVEATAEYIFEEEGEYDVTLKVIDDSGEFSQNNIKITVVGEGIPQAVITTEPTPPRGHVPVRIKFGSTESTDADGTIVKYEWDFGDGSPLENGQGAVHNFTKVGIYKVKLTIWDDDGMFDTAEIKVEAEKPLVKPVAVITVDKDIFSGAAPFKVGLDGIKSQDEDGSIVSYSWDFGDGSTPEEGQIVEHTYTQVGQYEVTLTVTDNDELVAVKKEIIRVIKPAPLPPTIIVAIIPDPPTVNVGDEVYFDASASYDPDGNIISYEWDFGDAGAIRLGPAKVRHKYTKSGIYTVKIKAYDNSGKTSLAEVKVAVHDSDLVARISSDKTEGEVPLVVKFEAVGDGTISSYEWDFGDGLKSASRSPLHIFTTPGDYTVILKATDASGTVSEDSVVITVVERQ